MSVFPATPIAAIATVTIGCGGVLYGLITALGRPARWGGPAFHYAQTVDKRVWGFALVFLGLAAIVGLWTQRLVRNVGLYGIAAVLCTLAATFLSAAARDPHASYGGAVWLVVVAVLAVGLAQYAHRPGPA